MYPTHYHAIVSGGANFLLLIGLMLLAPAAVTLDLKLMANGIPEASMTEYAQELLLLLTAGGFFLLARRHRELRGFAILVGGFFATLLIRELDSYFDQIVHGFWKYPATLWVCFVLQRVIRHRATVLPGMASAARSPGFARLLVGLAVVIGFSRVFGTTSLWKLVLDGAPEAVLVKNVVQEGVELLGYLVIFSGFAGYARELRDRRAAQEAELIDWGSDSEDEHATSVPALANASHRS